MDDKQLLELAAKAAGINLSGGVDEHGAYEENWNPLNFNDDAFKLAVHLSMSIDCEDYGNVVSAQAADSSQYSCVCLNTYDKITATRRAIVLCAAGVYE